MTTPTRTSTTTAATSINSFINPLTHLLIRNSRHDQTSIEAATQVFASILPYPHIPLWKRLLLLGPAVRSYSFEIYLLGQTIYFYLTVPHEAETFMRSLITSSYPQVAVTKTTDPMDSLSKARSQVSGEMCLTSSFYYPIKTYTDFKEIDPLSALVGYLSKLDASVSAAVQIIVSPASFPWQAKALHIAEQQRLDDVSGKYVQHPHRPLLTKKASFQGGRVAIRLLVGSHAATDSAKAGTTTNTTGSKSYLDNCLHRLAATFSSFSLGEGNQFVLKRPLLFNGNVAARMKSRRIGYFERRFQILNAAELATLWHPPGYLLSGVKNIAWGKTLAGEPPENLPIAAGLSKEERRDITFFAKTEYKNKNRTFGIKAIDRRRHVYIVGKSGAGKSTLIAGMAIDDIRKGRGVAVIDPHGDLSEAILDYIPRRRIPDVLYLEPFDATRPFSLNVFEMPKGRGQKGQPSRRGHISQEASQSHQNPYQRELIASGVVSIFYKLYRDNWGPRLEYILRNCVLTLLDAPGVNHTLIDILPLLADPSYRKQILSTVQDPILRNFWDKEYDKMPERLRVEAVMPIQNKVGQFATSKMIRAIIGRPHSSIDLEQVMNEGRILILNLSQGKLGEDNAALLGALVITQIQLAAMNRSFMKEEDRRDFCLYVDEFQNFATTSFIKILSEARKFRLCLTLANQYVDQLDTVVQKAIFGNAGTLVSFTVGAQDARLIGQEFGGVYKEGDLTSLGKHEIITKLSVGGVTSAPFAGTTLPLPVLRNGNKKKIIQVSRERYGRKVSTRR